MHLVQMTEKSEELTPHLLNVLLWEVIQDPNTHFFPVGCSKQFYACTVESRTNTFFWIKSDALWFLTLFHHITPQVVSPTEQSKFYHILSLHRNYSMLQ